MYNLTAGDNVTGLLDLWNFINTSSDNLFSPLFLFVITIVLFMISRQFEEDMARCMVFSGVITCLIGLLFVFAGMIMWKVYMFTVVFMFAGMMIFAFSSK